MPRLTIDEFRARLAGRAQAGPLLAAYRELARRTDRRRAALANEWIPWGESQAQAALRAGDWIPWGDSQARAA